MRGITVTGQRLSAVALFLALAFSHNSFSDESDQYKKGFKAYNKGDYQAAYKLILPIAAEGEPPALNLLGMMYELGLGVTKDTGRSVNYYRQAANKGYHYAQYNLAVSYDTGIGVPLNFPEAVKWYKRAAEQGASIAQYNLGVMYEEGRGTKKDYNKAAHWYREAANQGLSQAQNNLAWLYENGKGLETDLINAYVWFDLAAEQGIDVAGQKRDLIKNRLNEKELAQANVTIKKIKASLVKKDQKQ